MNCKNLFIALGIALLCAFNSSAQWYRPLLPVSSPPPASLDAYISQPGLAIGKVLDTLHSLLDPNDTGEGGPLDQYKTFQ